ncbi:mitochondrial import inner membrane translocase subunit tim54 [Teratosphaeriaceae sp. CCFEE 6253]|nr:mitochondrial import inner membrane translocase subunit tim54 [Teratosphaeriaceae sp. CCFEE 6253]
MSEPSSAPPAQPAANITAAPAVPSKDGIGVNTSATAPKKPMPDGNPVFRMMGVPRLRLPSRNWSIFFAITGSFASAVAYDKYHTRLAKQKWCDAVSHLAGQPLDTKLMPRRLTIYLSAPPGDGLRSAREHFHEYIKPILVAGAMDWDVVEGRKEGDVRFKTAERARRKRRRRGEGAVGEEDEDPVAEMRTKTGTEDWLGVGGDLIVGRNTWKEYVRGMHEGWLGPAQEPVVAAPLGGEAMQQEHVPGRASLGDAPAQGAVEVLAASLPADTTSPATQPSNDASPAADPPFADEVPKEAEEKPKPRNPPPYIAPAAYASSQISASAPEIVGPSTAIPFPHLLGIRNTPIRIYRFLTRRRLADTVGRDVAAAVLASSHRGFSSLPSSSAEAPQHDAGSAASGGGGASQSEATQVLAHEEKEWWKTTWQPRKEGEEGVWIEPMALDERIVSRMRRFELSVEDEERAKRIGDGVEKIKAVEAEG